MSLPIAAVVVTHNSAGHIAGCLGCLGGVSEAVVVDNASSDATCAVARQTSAAVNIIANETNRGFAAAVNQGIGATTSPFVLLLNPDAVVTGGWQDLLDAFAGPATAAVTGRMLGADGEDQSAFHIRNLPTAGALAAEALLLNRVWPGNPWNRRYRPAGFEAALAQDVEQPSGAFLLVRREALEQLGGLDERFHPLWFEDVDLCQRIHDLGLSIRYVPQASASHFGGHSIGSLSRGQREQYWYANLLRFGEKHFSAASSFGLRCCVLVGLALRWIAAWPARSGADARRAYLGALRSAAKFRSPVLVAPSSRAASPHSLASNPE